MPRPGGRTASLLLAALAACGGQESSSRDADRREPPSLRVELVSAAPRTTGLLPPVDGVAVLRVTNPGERAVGVLGPDGERPVTRLAVRDGADWIEAEPAWVECGLGNERGELAAGASVPLEVHVPSFEHEFRVGVGCYADPEDRPPWHAWTWSWSDPFRVDPPAKD